MKITMIGLHRTLDVVDTATGWAIFCPIKKKNIRPAPESETITHDIAKACAGMIDINGGTADYLYEHFFK